MLKTMHFYRMKINKTLLTYFFIKMKKKQQMCIKAYFGMCDDEAEFVWRKVKTKL